MSDDTQKLASELKALSQIILGIRKEISEIKPQDIQKVHIPTATDELDAVVLATEEATGTIMDSAEKIMELSSDIDGDKSSKIVEEVTKIFEACSFQDITGQRINKVVSAFKEIDKKVNSLVGMLSSIEGGDTKTNPQKTPKNEVGSDKAKKDEEVKDTKSADEIDKDSLLNGPGMPGEAMNQDDVDKLLSD